MSEMLVVQKGVPIPEIDRTSKKGRRKYPIETMAVGEMVFVEGSNSKSLAAYISRTTKDLTGKFSTRHCWMKQKADGSWEMSAEGAEGAKEGTGVWRTE